MKYVLDTSAIMSRRFNISGSEVIVPRSVIEEIQKGKLKYILDALDETLTVQSPSDGSVMTVKNRASDSGDLERLSGTDIDVIALALDTGSKIVSDDYAIQNVASLLSLEYMGADLSEIRHEVVWRYRCTGCRKVYEKPVATCDVCGHEVVRTRSGSRMKRK